MKTLLRVAPFILSLGLSTTAFAIDTSGITQHDRQQAGQALKIMLGDSDGDGLVTLTEFQAQALHRFNRLDNNNTGNIDVVVNGANQINSLEDLKRYKVKRFNHADPDGDSKLSEAEFLTLSEDMFAYIDSNVDGAIDFSEAKLAAQAYKRKKVSMRDVLLAELKASEQKGQATAPGQNGGEAASEQGKLRGKGKGLTR